MNRPASLQHESQLQRAILDALPAQVALLDREGVILVVNEVWQRSMAQRGLKDFDPIGVNYLKLCDEVRGPEAECAALAAKGIREILAGTSETFALEYPCDAPTSSLWFRMMAAPIREDGCGVVVLHIDITERKNLESKLVFTDRMVSMGTLSAGVAHEINNPLVAVTAGLDLIARDIERVAELTAESTSVACSGECYAHDEIGSLLQQIRAELADAREGAARVESIVRDLKLFARTEDEHPRPVDLAHVLASSIALAWNEIRHRARLVKDFAEVPFVLGTEARLGQVFLHLLTNAAQAIPEGHAQQHEIQVVLRAARGQRVVVEIRDTGAGIAPELLARIFDPFFTTKPVGVGMGLGLSICHGIVSGFGGELSAESEVGRGSVFRVTLPASVARQEAAPVAPRPAVLSSEGPSPPAAPSPLSSLPAASSPAAPSLPLLPRRGRVLVVDDEPLILTVIRRILGREHDVIVHTRAREALGRLLEGERYDVILCDVMMPEMSGIEFHEEVARLLPDQLSRIVFITGGTFTSRTRTALEQLPNTRLDKPFEYNRLLSLIRDHVG